MTIREADIQDAIWDCFEHDADRMHVLDALLRLLPNHLMQAFQARANGRVWAWKIGSGRFGPDLVLVDDADNVLMVIELKLHAAENLLLARTVSRGIRKAEAAGVLTTTDVAAEVADRLGVHADRYHSHHPHGECECPWHSRRVSADGTVGWVRTISQFDAYLTFGWLHDGMRATEPAVIPFLFIGGIGVPVHADTRAAFFGTQWTSSTLTDFKRALLATGPSAGAAESHLRQVLSEVQ